MLRRLSLIALAAGLASCTAPPKLAPPPKPVVTPKPTPGPAATPPPAPRAVDWNDWPFTPGDWVYRRDAEGSIALFGPAGDDALLTLRCNRTRAALYLSVPGPATGATVRTTTLTRVLPLQSTGGTANYVATQLAPTDALLDAIVFSRGRFVVQANGAAPLVIPTYAEIGRVVEDCR